MTQISESHFVLWQPMDYHSIKQQFGNVLQDYLMVTEWYPKLATLSPMLSYLATLPYKVYLASLA